MTGAIVIRWGASVPGREAKSLEVFGESLAYFEGLAKKGRIHSHKEYLALTGGPGGFMLVEGLIEELQAIHTEDATLRLILKAETIVQDFDLSIYAGGADQTVNQEVTRYMETIQGLGYL